MERLAMSVKSRKKRVENNFKVWFENESKKPGSPEKQKEDGTWWQESQKPDTQQVRCDLNMDPKVYIHPQQWNTLTGKGTFTTDVTGKLPFMTHYIGVALWDS